MADDSFNLGQGFPTVDESDWQALAQKALKGGSLSRLETRIADGLILKPLYREADWPSGKNAAGFPGVDPFIRGCKPTPDPFLPWDIRQVFAHPDLTTSRAEIFAELEAGVSSVELKIDPSGQHGLAVTRTADFAGLLNGFLPEIATIALAPAGESVAHGLELAALLAAHIEQTAERNDALIAFNVDPLGELARTGQLPTRLDDALSETAAFAAYAAERFPSATALRADARVVHEAGGTPVQELAYALAVAVSYVRSQRVMGVPAGLACQSLIFTVSVGAEYLPEIAKLRALRRLWSRAAEAFGAPEEARAARVQAVTSRRMLAVRDPWVNMLRASCACFAAGVGGADIVTVRTFTEPMGLPSTLARRVARNTQIIAQEECGLGRVADPLGGTWAVEAHADALAQAAWTLFQTIDARGGIEVCLLEDWWQSEVAKARFTLRTDVARRKIAVLGVSEFAQIQEQAPEIVIPPAPDFERAASADGPAPTSRRFADLVTAARGGASLARLNPEIVPPPANIEDDTPLSFCEPLWPIRLAEPFENLRALADARRALKPSDVQVLLVTLGPLAEYQARAGFAANLFAAGGLQAISAEPVSASADGGDRFDPHAYADAWQGSGTLLVCLCGSDARYQLEAEAVARAFKARGCARVYMAGKPGENEAALRAAGVDAFIFMGLDTIAALEIAHAEIGILTHG